MEDLTLERAKRGDADAFEALMTPEEGRVWALCLRMLGNTEEARDAAQETMIRAWRALPSFRGEARFGTWVYRIAVRTCLDRMRKREETVPLETLQESGFEPMDPAPEPEGRVLQAEKSKVLRQALDRLPEEMRTALVLTSMDGQSYEEAAEVLEVPVGTVRSRIARAKLKLQKILLETGNYFGKTASKESEGGRKG